MLRPTRILGAYWVLIVVATLLLYPTSVTSRTAVALIAALVGAFTLAVMVAVSGTVATPRELEPVPAPRRSTLLWVFQVGVLCNLGAAVLAVRSHGFTVAQLVSGGGLLDVGNAVSVARYSGDATGSGVVSALLALGYAAAIVAPFLRTFCGSRNVALILPFLSCLAYSTVTTARLPMLISAALTLGGLIAAVTLRDGRAPSIRPGTVVRTLAAAALLAAAFTAVAVVRVGTTQSNVVHVVLDKQRVYALGSVPAFSGWLHQYENDPTTRPPLQLGAASVAGMQYVTGHSRATGRAYGDFQIIDQARNVTNVYTIFRGLILDVGEPGAFLAVALAGFAFGRLYRAAVARRSWLAAAGLACGYAIVLLSNTMAITTFTNVLTGMLLGVLALRRAARHAERPAAPESQRAEVSARSA